MRRAGPRTPFRRVTNCAAGSLALCAALIVTGCSSGSDTSPATSSVTTTADSLVDHIIADVSPDGIREQGEHRVSTFGAKAQVPPDWPSDLALPDDFELTSSFWDTTTPPGATGREQEVAGRLPGVDWRSAFATLEGRIVAAGFVKTGGTTQTKSPVAMTLHARKDGRRVELQVAAPTGDQKDNSVILNVMTEK